METDLEIIRKDISRHQEICEELLEIVVEENRLLRSEEPVDPEKTSIQRKKMLAFLGDSLERIKTSRGKWMRLDRSLRAGHPELVDLLKQTQDVIAKVMLYDRENEQLQLRRGLLSPAHIPSFHQQMPHYVASLYQRHAPG